MDLHLYKLIVLHVVIFKFLEGISSGASLSNNEMLKPYPSEKGGEQELVKVSMDRLDKVVYDRYAKYNSFSRKPQNKFYGFRENYDYPRKSFRIKANRKPSSATSHFGKQSPAENSIKTAGNSKIKIPPSSHDSYLSESNTNGYETGHQIETVPLHVTEPMVKLESIERPSTYMLLPAFPSYAEVQYKPRDLENKLAGEAIPKSAETLISQNEKEMSVNAKTYADPKMDQKVRGDTIDVNIKNIIDQNLNKESPKRKGISKENYMPSVLSQAEENADFKLETSATTENKNAEVAMVNLDAENELTVSAAENVLQEPFEGSGELESAENARENVALPDRSVRIIDFFARVNSTSACITPKGESGQCRPFRDCLLSDALNNFNLFLQYMCLLQGTFVGICCPDNPVIEISDSSDNATGNITVTITQPSEGCGMNTKVRIVGGTISVPHEWTWMVALLRRNRFFCGGVIINDWYVLTAAHCVMGMRVSDLKIRLGEYNFQEQNEHQQDISVAEIKRHAQFVSLTFQHDIALLKLKRRIEYSKFVGSICLPNKAGRDYSDANATVVGWGTVSFGGAASPVLRQVTIPVWKNEECDKTYALESITDAFMCAGSPKNGEDACQGDSGGPLMALNDDGRWEVIGIVSWGRRCGDPTYPGVYTRITSYLNWIIENSQ